MALPRMTSYLRHGRTPVTTATIVLLSVSFLARLFFPRLTGFLAFYRPGGASWGALTYPLADTSPLTLVLGGLWFYLAGGHLEVHWGAKRYALVLALLAPASALPLWLGSLLLGGAVVLAGIALPLACLTVAWCLANPEGVVSFGYVLPIPVRFFLWLEILLVYAYSASAYGPLLGFFALGGPALTYLYVCHAGPERKWRAAVRRGKLRRLR